MTDRMNKLLAFYEDNKSDDFIVFALAKEYEKLQDFDKAMEKYLELVTRNKYYIGAYYHLGKLYQEIEDFDNALSTFNTGIKLSMERKDLHALAELQNAKTNLEMEML